MTWSPTLAGWSQKWASQGQACSLVHSTDNDRGGLSAGENIFVYFSDDPVDGVKWWYDEISLYNYGRPGFDFKTGHFTQVVWRNTTEVGCAVSRCASGRWENTLVCQYTPPGNYQGQFPENVPPLLNP